MLILICGLPGTGKSTLAKALTKKFHFIHFNTDIIRKKTLKRRTYSEKEKAHVYEMLFAETEKKLKKGKSIILDGTFYRDIKRKLAASLAKKYKTKFFIVECILNENEIRKRIEKRVKIGTISEADFLVYKKVKKQFEPIKEKHLKIDCALPIVQRIKMVKKWVNVNALLLFTSPFFI